VGFVLLQFSPQLEEMERFSNAVIKSQEVRERGRGPAVSAGGTLAVSPRAYASSGFGTVPNSSGCSET
jgi:hypothetical protein